MNKLAIVHQNIRQIPTKVGMGLQMESAFHLVRDVCFRAVQHLNGSRQMCVLAGQMLRELKANEEVCRHGDFLELLEKYVPEISRQTASTWMRAAAVVAQALKFPDVIEIDAVVTPLSEILAADDGKLSKAGKAFKQTWFNFTDGKSLKECTTADEVTSLTRSLYGKHSIRAGGGGDRKDFPKFIGRKLSQLTTHLEHYKNFTGPQLERTEMLTKQSIAKWPGGYLELVSRLVKDELKTR